jgi:hypothetical protein
MSVKRCSKKRYRDEIGARFALAMLRHRGHHGHTEASVYRCQACKGWHLTSKPGRNGDLRWGKR